MKKRFLSALLTLCMAFALLPAAALADDTVIDTEAELNAAIEAVAENGTVTLGGNITLADTLLIGGTKSFTLDLNGFTLDFKATNKPNGLIYFTGTGTLTITDSRTGGKLQADFNSAVQSNGSGKIIISGNASIISTDSVAIHITGGTADSDVLEIAGDVVVNGCESTRAIYNVGNGDVTVAGGMITAGIGIDSSGGNGNVTVSGGTVKGIFQGIWAKGNVILTGGTVEGYDNAIKCTGAGQITISGGTVILKSGVMAMSKAPETGYKTYQWRTASDDAFTPSTTQEYTYDAAHTYVEFAPVTYAVTLPTGTGYTVAAHGASVSPVASGGSFSFTVAIAGGYHKEAGFAVKANGTTLIADGSGVYTISGIAQNQAVSVEGVAKDTPVTYTVTLPTGIGYTTAAYGASVSPVTSGGSFSFTVAISGGYHKEAGFAVKACGTTLIADGNGVYTISGITQNQAVSVEGVAKDTPAPGGDYIPPADTIVYNDTNKPNATIWLSGSGLSGNDLLVTQVVSSGSNYNAMLKLADKDDIFRVYNISLESGKKPTGSAMYLTFDLTEKYAGQAFTLVHKKADGTYEYLHAVAGADGKLKFGPIHELSPFMLVKGRLLNTPTDGVGIPNTGDASGSLPVALLALAAVCGMGAIVNRKRRIQT